jgi:hypothetical protein
MNSHKRKTYLPHSIPLLSYYICCPRLFCGKCAVSVQTGQIFEKINFFTATELHICRPEFSTATACGRLLNPLNPELNPICYLLALLAHHFLHVSKIRVKSLTLRLLMSYIYIYMEGLFLMFLDHTQRRSTVGSTPLDE